MPVITTANFMLTSRGRVVYGLLSIDRYNECVNEYISDEFHQFVSGRKMNYNESDIEKVIYFPAAAPIKLYLGPEKGG
jgi:hypothetical protein